MKKNEKRNILILSVVSIIIILVELVYVYSRNDITEEYLLNNEKLLGITDVTGEGIIINIKDGRDLIHQEDIIILLDELKNAGAEAISVNEQRIVKDTYIYCDGSVILIDGVKIGNPFAIKAIGDIKTIYGAITRNKGYIETLTKDGIIVEVEKNSNIEIKKTNKKLIESSFNNKDLLRKVKITDRLIGNTNVLGGGVQITIDTSNTQDITALTLLQLINDLNSAGADAISINGNRVMNMTDIMDINKEYILLDSNCISSPYQICAIGNIKKLKEVINLENSVISKLEKSGKDINIKYKWIMKVNKYVTKRGESKLTIKYMK